jgi:hypothetical protein
MNITLVLILCLIIVFLIIFIFLKLENKINLVNEKLDMASNLNNNKMNNTEINSTDQKKSVTSKDSILSVDEDNKGVINQTTTSNIDQSQPVDNFKNELKLTSTVEFKLTQARVQGNSHKKSTPSIPCQDFGKAGILPNGDYVIIVSDGAGASKLSHIASEFCVNTLFSNLQLFDFSDLIPNADDPKLLHKSWNKAVLDLFGNTRNALLNLSKNNKIPPTDLYCTLLLVIKTNWGFLSANIGDGRSGVSNGKPHALSVPLQTFTAGATFFLIKDGWENIYRTYIAPVTDWEKIKYFFATTDGCQDFVMDWSDKGPRQGIYDNVLGDEARYDCNVPYEPFFDGLMASLNEVSTEPERNERLKNLIENGIYVAKGEEKILKSISDPLLDDDKTLIIFHK